MRIALIRREHRDCGQCLSAYPDSRHAAAVAIRLPFGVSVRTPSW
jgi:hypothetical protein